jgi:hypothetical protein
MMTYELVKAFPDQILFKQEGPFISLYLPTHRHEPENKQDPIVYKHLLKTVESSLAQKYSPKEIEVSMSPLRHIEEDIDLWNNTLDGLAVLSCPKRTVIYLLHDTVEALAIVADRFQTKQLIKAFQSIDQYQLLGLSSDSFALYHGNQNGIEQIHLAPGTPSTMEEVLGNQLTDSYLTQGSYNGTGRSAMYHGHGGAKPEIDKDTEKFFRYVDRFVEEQYSKPSKLPLILVALKEHHPTFAAVSNNHCLLKEGIKGEYMSLSLAQLREKTWEIIEPIYLAKIQENMLRFEQAKAGNTASDSLAVVSKAIFENRVETLFVDAERTIPGKVSPETGEILERSLDNPDIGDVLDTLAQLALQSKSEVIMLPSAAMPGTAGIAAIFRY